MSILTSIFLLLHLYRPQLREECLCRALNRFLEALCTEQGKTWALLHFKGTGIVPGVFFTKTPQTDIHSTFNKYKKYPLILLG